MECMVVFFLAVCAVRCKEKAASIDEGWSRTDEGRWAVTANSGKLDQTG